MNRTEPHLKRLARRLQGARGARVSSLGAVTAVAGLDQGVELLHAGGRQRLRFLADDVLQIRLSGRDTFEEDFSYALDDESDWAGPSSLRNRDEQQAMVLTSPRLAVRVSKADGSIEVLTSAGRRLSGDAAAPTWRRLPEGECEIILAKKLHPAERLLGLGDKAAGVDRRGHRFRHWNTDAFGFGRGSDPLYKSIPFVLGLLSDGTAYGLFVDSFAPSTFDLGRRRSGELCVTVEAAELTYYILHAPSPLEVVERYARLTGRTPMLPRWALGYHQCRYSYDSEAEMRRVAYELRSRRIPCDTLYFDIHYMDSFRVFTWDRRAFPEPENLIHDLHDDGFTTVAIIDPGVSVKPPDDPVLRDGLENDVFVRHPDGRVFEGAVWPGKCHFPDFHRSNVRSWWAEHLRGLLDSGLDGIWCDMNEPAVFVEEETGSKAPRPERTMPDDLVHHVDGRPMPHRAAHNAYGQQMHRATYDAMRGGRPNRRPFVITRAAYAGSQRFGTTWTGDNSATWKHLRLGLEQCLSLNVSGFPFCGADVGGFSGTPTGELMARWTQAGVLTPLFRNHSSVDTPRQEPWLFGKKVEDACRKAIELRYRLLPYLYTALHDTATRGTPIMRPLELTHPFDPVVANKKPFGIYLGDSLLAYPVLKPRRRSLKAYLPEEAGGWFDFHTGEHLGAGFHRVDAPLDRLPLFVRAGTVLPLGTVVQSTAHLADQPLTLRVYPADGAFESHLYEDAGDGPAHEDGDFFLCKFRGEGSADALTLDVELEGAFDPSWREWRVEVFAGDRQAQRVLAGGSVVDFEQGGGVVRCSVPVGARIEVLWEMAGG